MTKEEVVKLAITAVREYDKKQRKSRQDKRLRNTKLLLENYKLLREHCERAICKKEQEITTCRVVDVLDELDKHESKEMYIESIKASIIRTQILLAHIDEMLILYKVYSEQSKRPEDQRRYRVCKAYYFEEIPIPEIATQEVTTERTVYRDIEEARKKLSALIFGIDGLYCVS